MSCGGGDPTEPEQARQATEHRQSFFPPVTIPGDANTRGMWSPVYTWPGISVHTVVLPDGRVLTYGSNPITIRYLRSGKGILREVTRVDAGSSNTSTTRIADNIDNIAITVDSQGATTITSSTAPRYARRAAGAASPLISIVTVSKPRNP